MNTAPVMTDILLDIATGRSRRELHWKNTQVLWSQLAQKLKTTHRTVETVDQYAAESKPRQDEIKDIGGFVGGLLTGGRRKPEAVMHRGLLTLDLDSAPADLWEDFTLLYDFTALVYSTHKHTAAAPRLRLLIPLDRVVTVTEYEAIGRKIAGQLGIEAFDDTGFQSYRLMYWPSTSKDGEYVYHFQEGPLLCTDEILGTYQDYTDASQWPVSSRVSKRIRQHITKQGDPLTKRGIVGAFCRLYSIAEAIDEFLPGIYEPVETGGDRYSYTSGSTAGGMIVYDNKYAYSHHGTDPISGKLCNAFDLVRLHLFGLKDDDTVHGTGPTKLPSWKAMLELCSKNDELKIQIGQEKMATAAVEFAEPYEDLERVETEIYTAVGESGKTEPDKTIPIIDRRTLGLPVVPVKPRNQEADTAWMKSFEMVIGKEEIKYTINNIVLILRNDPRLAGRLALNQFSNRPVVLGDLPWQQVCEDFRPGRLFSDDDAAGLRHYLELIYGIAGVTKIKDAVRVVCAQNAFHPIRNYLSGLRGTWDGVDRFTDLMHRYFGCERSEYMHAITRKWFTANVARVFTPGIKFDSALILVGEEGILKSTFFKEISDPWFTDNFSFHMIGTSRAIEQITGYWIVEIGELTGYRDAELEAVKAFVSREMDIQRGAFREFPAEWLRQNTFAGSTNRESFLKGFTGNRRFWVAQTYKHLARKPVREVALERDQLWAQALDLYDRGEPLFLDDKLEEIARQIQQEHTELDDRWEIIQEYLEKQLPEGWDKMMPYERRGFLMGDDTLPKGTVKRVRVSVPEIWTEALGCQVRDMNAHNTKIIHDIMRKMPGWKAYKNKMRFGIYGVLRAYVRETAEQDQPLPSGHWQHSGNGISGNS